MDKPRRQVPEHVPELREWAFFAIITGFMKIHIAHLSVALFCLLTPLSVMSQGYLTTYDSIAGLGAEVSVEELDPKTSYTLEISPPDARAFSFSLKTDATGASTLLIPGT